MGKPSFITYFNKLFVLLLLILVFLEAGFRIEGFILSSIQEYKNFQSIRQKGTYRILCLGESTTRGQYPQFLEQALNMRDIGVRFTVLDEGKFATDTSAILSRVESYLVEYHPDMVVAMMGINDERVEYDQDIPESEIWLFRHCRVYRFATILYKHILRKITQNDTDGLRRTGSGGKDKPTYAGTVSEKKGFSNEMPMENIATLDFKGAGGTSGLKNSYEDGGSIPETEASLTKAIEMDPENDQAYAELGRIYRKHGEFSQAEDSLKKSLEINPKNDNALAELGWLYKEQDEFLKAEDSFKNAIELNPRNDKAYAGLGRLYRAQEKFSQSEDSYKKAIELNPKVDHVYAELGELYRFQRKFSEAEDLGRRAIDLNPRNVFAFFELVGLYRGQDKLSEADEFLRKAIVFNPKSELILRAMASLYEEIGKPELAREYAEKATRLRSENYPATIVNNYRKLKEILDRKGIKLVCVQYPVRNVDPLKRIFEKDEGVIFVDNEGVFKEALKKASYKEYFKDMLCGDFGHCTQKGNELLAQNIANVILREVFNK